MDAFAPDRSPHDQRIGWLPGPTGPTSMTGAQEHVGPESFVDGVPSECPPMSDPRLYLRTRSGSWGFRFVKRWSEERAINSCLRAVSEVRTLCDCPCGPGRLFPYWKKRGFAVIGVELSAPAVAIAIARLRDLDLQGAIIQGNAFDLPMILPGPVDLVSSVGFIYYFPAEKRVALLRSIAMAARRYVLAQYKTVETAKGRRNAVQTHRYPFQFCTYEQMTTEARQAGLECRRIAPIGRGSDRVLMLLSKP